jgi:hypothetical protein
VTDSSFLRKNNGQLSLAERAERIRAGLKGILLATTNIIDLAFTVGDELIQAKKDAGHGNWLAWLERECDLSEDKAERYMRIARGRAVLEANSARVRNLSLAAAERLINESDPSRRTGPRSTGKTKKQANSLDALRWWGGASLEQRRHFLDGAGRPGIQAAVPTEWRPLSTSVPAVASTEAPKGEAAASAEGDACDLLVTLVNADDSTIVGPMFMLGFDRWLAISPPSFLEKLETRFSDQHLDAMRLVDLLERRLERAGINATTQLRKIRAEIKRVCPQIDLTAVRIAGSA